MTEVVNLRIARKRRAREDAARTAVANRLTHGVARVEARRIAANRDNSRRKLDQHIIETGERQ